MPPIKAPDDQPKAIHRLVAAMLPHRFEDSDAPAVIYLAAAALALVAAVGHEDKDTLGRVLDGAAATIGRLSPKARENIDAAASELVEASRQGKDVLFLGGFGPARGKPAVPAA